MKSKAVLFFTFLVIPLKKWIRKINLVTRLIYCNSLTLAIIINSSQPAISRKIFLYRSASIKGTIANFSDTLK